MFIAHVIRANVTHILERQKKRLGPVNHGRLSTRPRGKREKEKHTQIPQMVWLNSRGTQGAIRVGYIFVMTVGKRDKEDENREKVRRRLLSELARATPKFRQEKKKTFTGNYGHWDDYSFRK